jgi:hypothetical protein
MSSWLLALKEYNKGKIWSIPPKGSLEYNKVKKIQQKYEKKNGSGIIKDTFTSIVDTVNNGIDMLLPQDPSSLPLMSGEHHAKTIVNGKIINYTFLGPSTHVNERLARGDKPIDNLDKYAKEHDKTYTLVFKKKLQKGIKVSKEEVQRADDEFVAGVVKNRADNPLLASLIPKVFKAKKIAENTGVLSHTAFFDGNTGNGLKVYKPPVK